MLYPSITPFAQYPKEKKSVTYSKAKTITFWNHYFFFVSSSNWMLEVQTTSTIWTTRHAYYYCHTLC